MDDQRVSSTLGNSLVSELACRGLRGAYFDYNGYQSLRAVSTVEDMQTFLDLHGFESVLASGDPAWLADGLSEAAEDKRPPWWAASWDAFSLFPIAIWLLTRLRRKRKVFPRYATAQRLSTQ